MAKINNNVSSADKEICGLIMPISSSDGYPAEHWLEVKAIISECVNEAGFHPKLVSEATETSIIHSRIVENIYANPIVVCDISSRNPNVMFELGVRLTFDKPVVIIRDDSTERIFDTDIIEYLEYPKNLRYSSIQIFKENLIKKITATHEKFKNPNSSFFLKNFTAVKVQKLDERELDSTQLILRAIEDLKRNNIPVHSSKSSAGPLIKITAANMVDVLNDIVKNRYNNDFTQIKNQDASLLRDQVRETFMKIPGANRGIFTDILEDAVRQVVRVINDNDTLDAAEVDLIF